MGDCDTLNGLLAMTPHVRIPCAMMCCAGTNILYADSVNTVNGVVTSGTVADTIQINQVYYTVQETGKFEITFSFISLRGGSPARVEWVGRYEGSSAHEVKIYAYNWVTDTYDAFTVEANDFPSQNTDYAAEFNFLDLVTASDGDVDDYINASTNEILIKIYHVSSANPNHDLYTDMIRVWERSVNMPTAGEYVKVVGLQENIAYINDRDSATGIFTINKAGYYAWLCTISFAGTTGGHFTGKWFLNGVEQNSGRIGRLIGETGDIGSAAGIGGGVAGDPVALNVGDELDFRFKSTVNDAFISFESMSLFIMKLFD